MKSLRKYGGSLRDAIGREASKESLTEREGGL